MDTFADARDLALLARDRYTFNVMRRIMEEDNLLTLSDHERLILCRSDEVHPVWVWTPDGAPESDMERAYRTVRDACPFDRCKFNIKHDLAAYFIRRAAEEGVKLVVLMDLLAYDNPRSVPPKVKADGAPRMANEGDLSLLADFTDRFYTETGTQPVAREIVLEKAKKQIADGKVFFWRTADGTDAAVCKYRESEDIACLNMVYTRPECRRKHYAQNLVYYVTELARAGGRMPMLYTDENYAASNACYMQIGYCRRGGFCTLGREWMQP